MEDILECKMRPGAMSRAGFLSPQESLQAIITSDSPTLTELGLTHQAIASVVEDMLAKILDKREKFIARAEEDMRKRTVDLTPLERSTVSILPGRKDGIPDAYKYEDVPPFSLNNLPSTGVGYMLDEKYQIFVGGPYRGFQDCPWGCARDKWSDLDFVILNRKSGESIFVPGLIVHLIREHQFFEGKGTIYRVDPVQLVTVLELVL